MIAILIALSALAASALGGFLLGCVYCWTSWKHRWSALDQRAAVLDQQAELLDMRSSAIPVARDSDSGMVAAAPIEAWPEPQRPMSLPPRNAGITPVMEDLFLPAPRFGNGAGKRIPVSPTIAEIVAACGVPEALPLAIEPPAVSVPAAAPLSLGQRLTRWYLRLPMPWFMVAVLAAVTPQHAEAPEAETTAYVGRHAAGQAEGAAAQLDEATTTAQRYAARTALVKADDEYPRIWDTREIVFPPSTWRSAAAPDLTASLIGDVT